MASALLINITTPSEGPVLSLRSVRSRDDVLVQIHIEGTATVDIYGRASKRMPMLLLASYNTDVLVPVARLAEIQLRVSSIGANSRVDADAYLDE